jgi:hypothetical protein
VLDLHLKYGVPALPHRAPSPMNKSHLALLGNGSKENYLQSLRSTTFGKGRKGKTYRAPHICLRPSDQNVQVLLDADGIV